MTTAGNAALERILLAPNDIARHAEIRSQLDAAGIDRPREGQGPLPCAVLAEVPDPAVDRCGCARVTPVLLSCGCTQIACGCGVTYRRFPDLTVEPPLVAGGQGRDGGQIVAGMMVTALLWAAAITVSLLAAMASRWLL